MKCLIPVLVLVLGCSAREPSPDRPAERPARSGEDVAAHEVGAEDERARVIRDAEAFVRAQGYTDTPPTVSGDAIVHEGIEGTIEDRRGMLEPRALRAIGTDGNWTVLFRYRDPAYAGRGRALRMRAGQSPAFVHQDMLLPTDGAGE